MSQQVTTRHMANQYFNKPQKWVVQIISTLDREVLQLLRISINKIKVVLLLNLNITITSPVSYLATKKTKLPSRTYSNFPPLSNWTELQMSPLLHNSRMIFILPKPPMWSEVVRPRSTTNTITWCLCNNSISCNNSRYKMLEITISLIESLEGTYQTMQMPIPIPMERHKT